jgi:K+-transporting ATPase ATPase B chain
MATEFIPAAGIGLKDLTEASLMSSLADELPREEVRKTGQKGIGHTWQRYTCPGKLPLCPLHPRNPHEWSRYWFQKNSKRFCISHRRFCRSNGGNVSAEMQNSVRDISTKGDTPLVVADDTGILGVIRLKDIVKKVSMKDYCSLEYGYKIHYDHRR